MNKKTEAEQIDDVICDLLNVQAIMRLATYTADNIPAPGTLLFDRSLSAVARSNEAGSTLLDRVIENLDAIMSRLGKTAA